MVESVPPRLYGGTERIVAWLVDDLVELGHDISLFASGDSATRAKLVAAWPRALRLGRPRSDPVAAQAALLETVAREAENFDVIHCHIDWLHLPLLSRLGVPFVTTLHGRLDWPGLPEIVRRFPGAPFVSISNNQRMPLSEANWLGTVYHGLPADSLVRPRMTLPARHRIWLRRAPAHLVAERGIGLAFQLRRQLQMGHRFRCPCPSRRCERRAPLPSFPIPQIHARLPIPRRRRWRLFGTATSPSWSGPPQRLPVPVGSAWIYYQG